MNDLKGSLPSDTVAPLRHARLLMLRAETLAARPGITAAASGTLQANVEAALDLFGQAATRQVTHHCCAHRHDARVTATSPIKARGARRAKDAAHFPKRKDSHLDSIMLRCSLQRTCLPLEPRRPMTAMILTSQPPADAQPSGVCGSSPRWLRICYNSAAQPTLLTL